MGRDRFPELARAVDYFPCPMHGSGWRIALCAQWSALHVIFNRTAARIGRRPCEESYWPKARRRAARLGSAGRARRGYPERPLCRPSMRFA